MVYSAMWDTLKEILLELSRKGLRRRITDRESPQGRLIRLQGTEVLNFSSNDYLGLAAHPGVKRAAEEALQRYGFGGGASRLLAGGTTLHRELEEALARFKNAASAVLFNTGYMANTGVVPSIADETWVILSDALNHASLIDGCRLSRAERQVYPHKDMDALRGFLKNSRKRPLIVTDTVFSMDGDLAPLDELYQLCLEYGAALYIDDAHGTGVLGGGRGALHHFGLKQEEFVIQMGTLSKAVGGLGAFVCADALVIDWLRNRTRTLLYSTALPPPVVAGVLEALRIIESDPAPLNRLWKNRDILYNTLNSEGFDLGPTETPIIPIMLKDTPSALKTSEFLLQRGIYLPAIRPPTVQTPRLRATVTALHTEDDIHRLVESLLEARRCGLLS